MADVPCLHCKVMKLIVGHYRTHGAINPATGARILDAADAIDDLGLVMGELVARQPDALNRRRDQIQAHAAIDTGVEVAATGQAQDDAIEAAAGLH